MRLTTEMFIYREIIDTPQGNMFFLKQRIFIQCLINHYWEITNILLSGVCPVFCGNVGKLLRMNVRVFISFLLICIPAFLVAQTTNFKTQTGVPRIPVLSAAPVSSSVGALYANSLDRLIYKYNGTQWIPIGGSVTASVILSSTPVLYATQIIIPDVTYVYSGGVGASGCSVSSTNYAWYRANDAMGTGKTTISSGTGAAVPYQVQSADVGKYIGLGITPVTACNIASFEVISWKQISAVNPSVASVSVTGLNGAYAMAGRTLTASFSGYSSNPVVIAGDLGNNCTYQWYYANDVIGTGKVSISGKTTSSYTVNYSDGYLSGKYVAVGVTPVAANGETGIEKLSSWYLTASLVPSYASVSIVGLTAGKAQNMNTLTALKGTYSVTPVFQGTEGTPVYKWYYATNALGTGKVAISGQTTPVHTVNVSAGYGYNATTGYLAVGITPVTTTGETGTEVLSSWAKVQLLTAPDGTPVYELVSPSGRVWMDRNLGATQAAISSTDYLAYGSLFQWCRAADGHQLINWTNSTTGTVLNGTTSMLSATSVPGHSLFVINPNSPNDWLSTQLSDGSPWWNGTTAGANSPCPVGYHVPTDTEWTAELTGGMINAATAYSRLKLPVAGGRYFIDGLIASSATIGSYWSSIVSGTSAYRLLFDSGSATMQNHPRAGGFNVRCIKN